MFTGIPPTINERPATVTAYVRWTEGASVDWFDVIETFQLRRNASGNGYYGKSGNSGPNVEMLIADTLSFTRYDVNIILRKDAVTISNIAWLDVNVTFRPPWGTTIIRKWWLPPSDFTEFQILA
jgi:hypothetical protein